MRLEDAGHTAHHAANQHDQPGPAERQHGGSGAEIGVVADEAERGEARGDHRADDKAAGARLERAAQLLNAEDDSGKRRVESGGDAGGGAGKQ